MDCNAKIGSSIIVQLQEFLREEIKKDEAAKKERKSIKVFPREERLFELNQVGYWCFWGLLKKQPFAEFLGKSDIFDFYYLFTHFDFSKFDVSWLIFSSERELKVISGRKTVRDKVRTRIAEALRDGNLSKKDEAKLTHILAKYFC